ncbi:MAG: GNAT family N-acetyltransferase [Prevotella sp.]|jgi:GNAT superfamily N-acetyltransferase|nr:GNAT family N-acetyltransferase [Prevotella sp.]
MNVTINPVEEKDFEELCSLFLEFATFEKLPERMVNTVEKMRSEKEYFQGLVARENGGKIIGYVIFFHAYYTWTGKSLYMDDLYIKEGFRGKGVGSKLIKEVISYARKSGCNGLRWQVSGWNTHAINFYENLGAKINKVEMNCDLIFDK